MNLRRLDRLERRWEEALLDPERLHAERLGERIRIARQRVQAAGLCFRLALGPWDASLSRAERLKRAREQALATARQDGMGSV